MSESHEQRIERLTDLARKVWPDAADVRVIFTAAGDALVNADGISGYHASASYHPRALAALESALLVLAGEPPQWATALVEKWRRELDLGVECDAAGTAHAEAVKACAWQLLAAAKGGAHG